MTSNVASTSSLPEQISDPSKVSSSPSRVDTQQLKTQLASVLGDNGRRYWSALLDFCTAKINRQEFHSVAEHSLHPDHLHFHNSLILGILYNASSDVPGPSSPRLGSATTSKSKRGGRLSNGMESGSTSMDPDELSNGEPSRKRLRHLVAGLTNNERARLKNIGQPIRAGLGGQSSNSGSIQGSIANLGWAGAGADLLGKKRRDEEKRKMMEDKRKVRELMTDVGSKDWRSNATQAEANLSTIKEKLPSSTQQAVSRGLVAPLCSESKELPDLEGLRDRMTVQAANAGLSGGVNPQAAAMLLSALQDHIQNVAGDIIEKIRSNRRAGIRTAEPLIPASFSSFNQEPSGMTYSYDSPMMRNLDLVDSSFSSRPTDTSSYSHSSRASPGNHSLRTVPSDLSSRTASTSLSGSLGVSFSSMGDSSMASTATALTSFANGTSYDGENGEDEEMENRDAVQRQSSSQKPSNYQFNRSAPPTDKDENTNLTVGDMSFLLSLDPTAIVEPLGSTNQERFLVPDWPESEDSNSSPQSSSAYFQSNTQCSSPSENPMAKLAKITSTNKMPYSTYSPSPSSPLSSNGQSHRSRYIIDGSAPLKLLDRKTLAETQYAESSKGNGRPTKGGLSINGSTNGNQDGSTQDSRAAENLLNSSSTGNSSPLTPHPNGAQPGSRKRSYKDELFEVVDPVSLLGALGE